MIISYYCVYLNFNYAAICQTIRSKKRKRKNDISLVQLNIHTFMTLHVQHQLFWDLFCCLRDRVKL